MSLRGFAAGSLALVVLEVAVQKGSSKKASGLVTKSGELFAHVLSPTVPGLRWYAGAGAGVDPTPGTPYTSPGATGAAYRPGPLRPGPQNKTIDRTVNGVGPVRST